MKKILITGANGYIGARLSKYLSLAGYSVSGICYPDIPGDLVWKKYFNHLYNFDLKKPGVIDKLSDTYYDVVIHLVSLDYKQSNGEPDFVNSVNVTPTWSLLRSFTGKNNIAKFIYFSTIHVYGHFPPAIISEDRMPAPQNIYGVTHLMSEDLCNLFNRISDTNCINVRLSNSYGSPIFKDNNCWGLVVNDLCKTAFDKKNIYLKSDGSPQRDLIHINDVCRSIEILINKDLKNIEDNIFHISSGRTFTVLDLAHLIRKIYNERYQKEINIFLQDNSISDIPDGIPKAICYTISNSRLKSLGFSPEFDLAAGINEIFEFLEHNDE